VGYKFIYPLQIDEFNKVSEIISFVAGIKSRE
jgi:hypothetical protein